MIVPPRQLIIIGDSNVYGWGDQKGGGWSERLRRDWMSLPSAPAIYPLGIRGDGLEKVAKRWKTEWQCRGELRRKVPNGLLLAIGLNDTARIGREDGRPQLSADAFKFGLERLLSDIKTQTNVLVLGLTPVKETAMPFADCLWYSNKSCSTYENQIEETCIELDIPFLPTYRNMINEKDWREWIEEDGIHLNSLGHTWIYNQVANWKSLLKWAEI
ncbi:GDSL-type esterase/lipase family protein [Prochlorococcus sp. MIT 1223]|uniref:GDSL-type esterase/lipase family protein n=1 Tax=Prochlorococcus sp. MIT 1223 TaxID=3096217 RepID=UPI002A752078|nr:GDSL-type esterase/lipase family protein [Prochlorococcus sp. MIT 1223]